MKCVNCGSENDRDAEFCENCGSPLKRSCAICGSSLKPGAKFCNKCGTPVSTHAASRTEEDQLAALRQAAPPELKEKIRTSSVQDQGVRKPWVKNYKPSPLGKVSFQNVVIEEH